ncbi:MAG: hypothetical protein WCO45_12540 [Pseudanabaena sp. ELA607]|jgi:hypothetical protein
MSQPVTIEDIYKLEIDVIAYTNGAINSADVGEVKRHAQKESIP